MKKDRGRIAGVEMMAASHVSKNLETDAHKVKESQVSCYFAL